MKKFMIALMILCSSVAAQAHMDIGVGDNFSERSIIKAGDYIWNDDEDLDGEITISVNLTTQMAYVKRGDVLVGMTNISSGKDGYETPEGVFTILGKEDNHWSKKYKAPMPYTMWVNNDGVALHSGVTPGRTTSHGCVHLPHEFAELLYSVTNKGAVVVIHKTSPASGLILNLR